MTRNQARRSGAVAPLVAAMFIPMMLVVALSMDGGLMMDARRAVQAAADEAALSAAVELYSTYRNDQGKDGSGKARQSAKDNAAANGFNTGNSTITVKTFGQQAIAGRFAGTTLPAGHVEVTIDYYQPRHFSSLLGSGNVPIRGHAVARGLWEPVRNGVITLKPSGDATLKANGSGLIQILNGDVIVNSNGSAAGTTSGGNAIVSTTGTFITGGYTGGGFTPTPQTGQPPAPDPLAYLPPLPIPSTNGTITKDNQNNTTTLTPGYFAQGFKETQGTVILQPGRYYFAKGFEVSGLAGLQGQGVLIYNAGEGSSQGITITGQGAVNLTPESTGTYRGITFFQARTSDSPINITGNGSFDIHGTVYAASANANIEGNGDASISGQVITGTLNVGGNGNTVIDFQAPEAPRTRIIQLVE